MCDIVAALLFVAGCVGFYRPLWYVGSVTLFLVGSVMFLLSALGNALVSTARPPEVRVVRLIGHR